MTTSTNTRKTTDVRKAIAGVTLLGALTLPLGGIAAASDGGGDRRAPTSESGKRTEGVKSAGETRTTKPEATPAGLKAECSAQIARRLADLDKLSARVEAKAGIVTADHKAAIDAIVQQTKEGLTALQAEIDAASTVDALKPLCKRIITDFRVYALVVPQVNLVLVADAISAKKATFDSLRLTLVEAIAAGRTPENGAKLDELLASFDAHVAAMLAAIDGVADDALMITVDDYNADPKILKPDVEAVRNARKEARGASRDAHHILELLQGDDDDDDEPEHPVAPSSTTTTSTTTTAAPQP